MKRLSFAVAASILLMPATTLAAFSTPGELMTAVQDSSIPRSFSVTAHAMNDGTYISVWATGAEQGIDPTTMTMTTKATIDVVKGKLKIRAKAELIATGGMLYARLTSFNGSYQNVFASLSGMLKQQLWVSMPLDEAMLGDITGGTALHVGSADPSQAENMFHMQSKARKNGSTVYTLTLTQDYAVTLAQLIREMLQDETPSTDDFFPWRQLAEGMRFESTVVTDAKDMFVSSAFSLSTASTTSSLSITGSEQRLGTTLSVKAPAGALTMDQALASFADLEDDVPGSMMPTVPEEMMPSVPSSMDTGSMSEGATFDSVDEVTTPTSSADCNDPSLTPQQLVTLQRGGFCPTVKKSTRYGGW